MTVLLLLLLTLAPVPHYPPPEPKGEEFRLAPGGVSEYPAGAYSLWGHLNVQTGPRTTRLLVVGQRDRVFYQGKPWPKGIMGLRPGRVIVVRSPGFDGIDSFYFYRD